MAMHHPDSDTHTRSTCKVFLTLWWHLRKLPHGHTRRELAWGLILVQVQVKVEHGILTGVPILTLPSTAPFYVFTVLWHLWCYNNYSVYGLL